MINMFPPNYPYVNNHNHNNNCKCTHMKPPVHPNPHYTSGWMLENAFVLNDTDPFIYDNTQTKYGMNVCVSENVITKVTQRRDDSCINLTAKFDMTDSIHTNTVLNHFLEQLISNQFDDLNGVLPIMKHSIDFKLYYRVEDTDGGIVHQSSTIVTCNENKYHVTDIRDYYVTSFTNCFMANIPEMDYQGLYTIVIEKVEAYASIIDTNEHLIDNLNPFYQFANTNTNIVIQHEEIERIQPDGVVMIGLCEINKSFPFQANITTRLRLSFTSFLSMLISTRDTFKVWESLYETSEAIIRQLQTEVELLKEEIISIRDTIGGLDSRTTAVEQKSTIEYQKGIDITEGQLVWLSHGKLYQAASDFISNNVDELTVEESMNSDIAEGFLVEVITDNE